MEKQLKQIDKGRVSSIGLTLKTFNSKDKLVNFWAMRNIASCQEVIKELEEFKQITFMNLAEKDEKGVLLESEKGDFVLTKKARIKATEIIKTKMEETVEVEFCVIKQEENEEIFNLPLDVKVLFDRYIIETTEML